jgi:predicted TIM-barrel enzyme
MPDYTRKQVLDRLQRSFDRGQSLLAVGAGTGISAKFAERGGADLIVIYNSGRYRMSGFGSCAGLLAYGDANAIVMQMGEREVLPVVKEVPVIAGVNGTDPTRRMTHFLKQVKALGFDGVNNFPTVGVIDGNFRLTLEETGMGFYKEVDMVGVAHEMDMFTIVYVFNPEEAEQMAKAGADVIIAHMGTTIGGTIGAETAPDLKEAAKSVQAICDAAFTVNPNVICVSHGGPISTAKEAAYINKNTSTVGFVGASSIERFACEQSIPQVTASFKKIPLS